MPSIALKILIYSSTVRSLKVSSESKFSSVRSIIAIVFGTFSKASKICWRLSLIRRAAFLPVRSCFGHFEIASLLYLEYERQTAAKDRRVSIIRKNIQPRVCSCCVISNNSENSVRDSSYTFCCSVVLLLCKCGRSKHLVPAVFISDIKFYECLVFCSRLIDLHHFAETLSVKLYIAITECVKILN